MRIPPSKNPKNRTRGRGLRVYSEPLHASQDFFWGCCKSSGTLHPVWTEDSAPADFFGKNIEKREKKKYKLKPAGAFSMAFNLNLDKQACEELIRGSVQNPRPKSYFQAMEILFPAIRKIVQGQVRLKGRLSGMDTEDFLQHVMIRLLQTHFQIQDAENPQALVFSMVRRILGNLIQDYFRDKKKMSRLLLFSEMEKNGDSEHESPADMLAGGSNPEMEADFRDICAKMDGCVKSRVNEKGYQLFFLDMSPEDLSEEEKAIRLGVSMANLYQLRTRYRKALLKCLKGD